MASSHGMVFAFYAPVVKLAYTLDSGSSGLTAVEVQLLGCTANYCLDIMSMSVTFLGAAKA